MKSRRVIVWLAFAWLASACVVAAGIILAVFGFLIYEAVFDTGPQQNLARFILGFLGFFGLTACSVYVVEREGRRSSND